MTHPPGSGGEPTGQEPPAVADSTSDAIEYPSIEYHPAPPPGYSLPPQPPPPTYTSSYPPPAGFPPPGAYPPPVPYAPPGAYPPPLPGGYPPPMAYPPPSGYPPPMAYPPPGGYPPPGAYPPPYAYSSPYPDQPGTNSMATASLVCSIVAIPLSLLCFGFAMSVVGIVLGIIALNQVSGTQQKGKEMAIAGIVVGVLGIIVMGIVGSNYF